LGYKKYLSDKGFTYSETSHAWIKALGWGRSIQVAMILKGLFEIKKDKDIVFSNFIDSFDEFKHVIDKVIDN
jgi:hypothetical protein